MQPHCVPNAISAGHAAEETRKHACKILRTETTTNIIEFFKKKLNKSSHNTHNHNKRDFVRTCTFCDSSHLQGKYPAYEKKFAMFEIKTTISKFAVIQLVKKYM